MILLSPYQFSESLPLGKQRLTKTETFDMIILNPPDEGESTTHFLGARCTSGFHAIGIAALCSFWVAFLKVVPL
jgi:hypothetical protein